MMRIVSLSEICRYVNSKIPVDALIAEYKKLFTPEGRRRSGENLQDFQEAIGLIGLYTTISVGDDER